MPDESARVLIIEDDDDTRANLCDILEMFGFETITARSGEQALKLTSDAGVDVILLDRRLGDTMADDLGLPRNAARFIVPSAREGVSRMERVGRRVPGYDARLVRSGRRYWDRTIELGLAGRMAQFMPPMQLEGLLPAA